MARVEQCHGQPSIFARLHQSSETRNLIIEAARTRRGLFPENASPGASLLERAANSHWLRLFFLLSTGVPALSLLAACSSPPPAITQESTPEISSTPELPHVVYVPFVGKGDYTPTPIPTAEPIITPQVCIPDEFARQHGYPTPVGLGGDGENAPDNVFKQILQIRGKLDTCQTLTPEEQAAVKKFNQEHSPLPDIISRETVQFVTLPPADMLRMQNEAAARGEFKLFSPAEIVQIGGEIAQTHIYPNNQINLVISFQPGITVTLPSLVGGKVLQAAKVNSYTNNIRVESDSQVWGFNTPCTSKLLVKNGQVVTPGIPLLEVSYNPNDLTQQGFETQGFGQPKGTAITIARQDPTTREFQQVTTNNLFRTPEGALVTVSSTSRK